MVDGGSQVHEKAGGRGHQSGATRGVGTLAYPGGWPSQSVLLTHDSEFTLVLQSGRRLGPTRVLGWSTSSSSRGSLTSPTDVPLNYALVQMNVPKVNERVPVLAIGSNATPEDIRRRFSMAGVSSVLPMSEAKVEGLAVGFAADVARGGYLPATPIVGAGLTSTLFVLWLDPRQLVTLDAAEATHQRVLLPASTPDGEGVQVVLGSGEVLGACYAYVSCQGCLAGDDGRPRPFNDQMSVIDSLVTTSPAVRKLLGQRSATWARRIVEPEIADSLRDIFRAEGWIVEQDALDRLIERGRELSKPMATSTNDPMQGANRWLSWDGFSAYVYSQILPATPSADGTWRAVAPREPIERQGEAIVRVSSATHEKLGLTTHVAVRPAFTTTRSDTHRIEATARLLVDDAPGAREDLIETDALLRTAIGAVIGEDLVLTPVRIRRRRWIDRFIGRPTYVTCRVQVPDRDMSGAATLCLLDALTLHMLGTDDGEEVVIEGQADDTGEVQQIRIKAYVTPEGTLRRREELHGGDFGSLFPSARDTLGTSEDIKWIYLDSRLRMILNLGNQHLATVRVRPSRSFQVRREAREMLLVLGLAFIGLIEIVRQPWARVGAMAVLLVVVVVAAAVRMRGRLSHRIVRG